MQSLPEVWKKGIEVNIFDRYTESAVSVVSSTSFSLSKHVRLEDESAIQERLHRRQS